MIFCLLKKTVRFFFLISISLLAADKQMVVVIPSYNNEIWCEQNIRSALDQNYSNFRIIFIDDCSKDQTFRKVQNVVNNHPQGNRVTLIQNDQRKLALHNFYDAIHSCKNNEVILTLDGDDWFPHNNVLQIINQIYQDPNVWITWGQYVKNNGGRGGAKPLPDWVIRDNSYRTAEFVTTHLRTFYAGLFKRIKKEDLMLDGNFLPMAWDLGFMYPMLEMAQYHGRYISDVLYVYNISNPISDNKVNVNLQGYCAGTVCGSPKYRTLSTEEFAAILNN